MWKVLKGLFSKKPDAKSNPLGTVRVDESSIIHIKADGTEQRLAWSDIIEVGVLTTDEGPFVEDFYFMLMGPVEGKGISIPNGATDSGLLLAVADERFPGFDFEAVVQASLCSENNRFVCWKKAS